MAIIKKSDIIKSGNVQIPANRYGLRVKEAVFGPSKSSGASMITLNCEIFRPAILETDEGKFNIDGTRVTHYISFSEKAIGRSIETLEKLGITIPEEFDTDNFDVTPLQGLKFNARLDSEPRTARQKPKPGQKVGDPILDDNGAPIISGWDVRITDIYDVIP